METKHNHSHFYKLLSKMSDNKDEQKKIKEKLISKHTSGRTTHLNEVTDDEYQQMLTSMKSTIAGADGDANVWRKRVMAAIGQYLRNLHKKEGTKEIHAVACRAAGYDDFNLIPVSRLQNIYAAFCNKNKDFSATGEIIEEDIEILTILN